MSQTLLAFKAGRAFRREGGNTVEPSATKGAIYLTNNAEDGLLHFQWKNRGSNAVEEDLILFPSDATFSKITDSDGRVYVLKFSSSDQRHFFWLQDASTSRDDEFVNNLNGYLQDGPEFSPTWGASSDAMSNADATSQQQQQQQSSQSTTTGPASQEQLNQLQNILSSLGGARRQQEIDPSLTDVFSPANIQPLFTSHPSLITVLFPHLPPDLPVPPSPDVVRRVINSPQFRAAVSNFDQALRTGLLGGLVASLGLPVEAGLGVGPFLRAVQERADREREGEDRMDTN